MLWDSLPMLGIMLVSGAVVGWFMRAAWSRPKRDVVSASVRHLVSYVGDSLTLYSPELVPYQGGKRHQYEIDASGRWTGMEPKTFYDWSLDDVLLRAATARQEWELRNSREVLSDHPDAVRTIDAKLARIDATLVEGRRGMREDPMLQAGLAALVDSPGMPKETKNALLAVLSRLLIPLEVRTTIAQLPTTDDSKTVMRAAQLSEAHVAGILEKLKQMPGPSEIVSQVPPPAPIAEPGDVDAVVRKVQACWTMGRANFNHNAETLIRGLAEQYERRIAVLRGMQRKPSAPYRVLLGEADMYWLFGGGVVQAEQVEVAMQDIGYATLGTMIRQSAGRPISVIGRLKRLGEPCEIRKGDAPRKEEPDGEEVDLWGDIPYVAKKSGKARRTPDGYTPGRQGPEPYDDVEG